MPRFDSRFVRLTLPLTALLHGAPVIAAVTPYQVNRAQSDALNCLSQTPQACEATLQRYVDAAADLLDDPQSPQASQALRLRATQAKLRRTAQELRLVAIETLAPDVQDRARALEQIAANIDALLGLNQRRATPPAAPALPDVAARVVEALPPMPSAPLPAVPPSADLELAHIVDTTPVPDDAPAPERERPATLAAGP